MTATSTPQWRHIKKRAAFDPCWYSRNASGSLYETDRLPAGSEMYAAPCLLQNEQSHARGMMVAGR